jgi:branched-chain amino acid transport system permease protein
MLGAYFVFWGITLFYLPWALAMVAAVIVTASVGILVDRVAYRPLRDAPRISALISAIGVSFFLQNVTIVVFGALPRHVYRPGWLEDPILMGDVRLLPLTLFVPALSLLLMLGLVWIVYKTKTGLGMRAISKDIETSYIMGVPVNRIISITFGIGSALAAASGIMWALRYPQLQPVMGSIPGFKAFIAAVFGGIGSIPGAVIGGLMLGLIEIMAVAFFPDLAGYRDAFAFVLLIVILLLKPTGLMGEKLEDKV